MTERIVIRSSPKLLKFYKRYLKEVTPKWWRPVFYDYRHRGLCHLVGWYTDEQIEMKQQFQIAGLCGSYPFGEDRYFSGRYNANMHLDEKRLQWVRDRIEDGKAV